MRILIATRNPGKGREYAELLAGIPAEWVTLNDLSIDLEVEETGSTLEENARLKAEAYARVSGLPTLADDSGLEVDALHGAPGIYSARYAGPEATDQDRYRKLLAELQSIPDEARTARFRCVTALLSAEDQVITAEGTCEGWIGHEPRGKHGFGYDPVFIVDGYDGKTMAELPAPVKNEISHRARALQAIRPALEKLFSD